MLEALTVDVFAIFADRVHFQDTVALVINEAGPHVAAALDAMVPDALSEWFFRDGTGQLGAGLISEDALRFQLTDAIAAADPDGSDPRPLILISGTPIFGNTMVEALQRGQLLWYLRKGRPAAEIADFEAWSVNGPALTGLFRAAKALPRCVVLSGDVHYANSSVNDVEILADGVATRYVQLTSSAARNATFDTSSLGFADDLLWLSTGEFAMAQMNVGKLGQPASPEAASLTGWLEEITKEWFDETFRAEMLAKLLYEVLQNYPQTLPELIEWQFLAPYNTAVAWGAEARYMMWSKLNDWIEFLEDPVGQTFGDYLFAPDVLRQQLIDLYHACGVDPALGHQVRRTMLRDLRYPDGPRLDLYRARVRFDDYEPDSDIVKYANQQWVQTVGGNNVGLVRFIMAGRTVRGVRHELLWYPVAAAASGPVRIPPDPAGLVAGVELPRVDWMGTVHECAWTAYGHLLDEWQGPVMS